MPELQRSGKAVKESVEVICKKTPIIPIVWWFDGVSILFVKDVINKDNPLLSQLGIVNLKSVCYNIVKFLVCLERTENEHE